MSNNNPFNINHMSEDEIKALTGQQIKCLDLTPFTAVYGTVMGYTKGAMFEDPEIQALSLLIDKEFEVSEELKESFVMTWDELLGEETLTDLMTVLSMPDKSPYRLLIDEVEDGEKWYIDVNLTKEIIETTKVLFLPFTHCASDILKNNNAKQ